MKNIKFILLLLLIVSFSVNAYSQLWKQHLDSAKSLSDQRNRIKAIEYYNKAKDELTKDSLETSIYASVCTNLGKLYKGLDKYEIAESLFITARQIREKVFGKKHPDYAASCNILGILYMELGQYKKAKPLYIEAKEIRANNPGKRSSDYAGSCNNLALLYLYQGFYDEAEPLFWEAIEIDTTNVGTKKNKDYAIDCDNLALLYREIGQYKKAEHLHLEIKELNEDLYGKNSYSYAKSCSHLAELYATMKKYEKSIALNQEAMQIRDSLFGQKSVEYAKSCNTLAGDYAETGEYEKAKQLFLKARQIRKEVLGKLHPDYAISCSNLGIFNSELGEYTKAEPYFLETRKIREEVLGKQHPDYSKTCYDLGTLYRNLHNNNKANYFYTEAVHSKKNQLKDFFQFASEIEKLAYIKKNRALVNAFFSFYDSDYSPASQGLSYEVTLANRNLILSSSQQLRNAIYNSPDTVIKIKYNAWIDSREQISFWYAKPIAERRGNIKDLEDRSNILEKELTRLSSDFRKEQVSKEITCKNIQEYLKPNEAAIEFVEFEYYNRKRSTDSTYYIGLVIRKDKPEPSLVHLFEKKQLDILLANREDLATDNRINTLYTKNKSLYHLTWKPLEKYLHGISKIYFASAGNLFKISFAALPVNDKQVLGDKYQLIQLNTTATVADNKQTFLNASDQIQLYGGVQYDADSAELKDAVKQYDVGNENSRSLPPDLNLSGNWKYLPGTENEASQIESLGHQNNFITHFSSGINATEESFKALSSKASPSVLHIATHGFFFPDPKEDKRDSLQQKFESSGKAFKQSDNPLFRSGLLFAGANNAWLGKPIEGIEDGILTAYEVSNMYLPNTKLVVLSACETALGDIQGSEGVYGLQRAFKMAGVQNLVMSLWKISDRETAEFMQLFYKNLFNRQSVNDAFYNAQTIMKNKYRNEPYKWAAWVLVR